MYGRLYLFPFGAKERVELEAAVDRVVPRYNRMPGLQQLAFFMDEETGVCGTFSQWESKEAAEAATRELAVELSELVEHVASSDELEQMNLVLPARLTFEIYAKIAR
jgi:hypothetical protein